MSKRYQLFTPAGVHIVGILECVPCIAYVASFDVEGNPAEYGGESHVLWDDQGPRNPKAAPIYVCAAGKNWRLDQLIVRVLADEEASA